MTRITRRSMPAITLPAITLPGSALPIGLTIRPQLVLRRARGDRRARRLDVSLLRQLPRRDRRARRIDTRLLRQLARRNRQATPAEWTGRAGREVRRSLEALRDRLPPQARTAIAGPAPAASRREIRPGRGPVIAGVATLVATAATVAIAVVIVRRRRGAASAAGETAGASEAGMIVPPAAAPAWLRRFVTGRFNPAVVRLGLVGGARSRWAFVEHVGQTSGTVYRTPVLPRIAGDFAYIPLPYGMDVAWVGNVRASGHCRLQLQGAVYELDEPAVISAAEHPDLPAALRSRLERRGNRYLRLHVLAATPGSLDALAEPTVAARAAEAATAPVAEPAIETPEPAIANTETPPAEPA